MGSDLDVYGAKQVAQDIETELVAFIPSESIAAVEQAQEGVLLGCGDDGSFQWTGHTFVPLNGAIDSEAVVDAVDQAYSAKEAFTSERDTTDDGVPRVRVRGPEGSTYSMALGVDRSRMEILSFSPCFYLDDDLSPRSKY